MGANPMQAVLAALRVAGHAPRRSGDGWSCTCPSHEDSSPSLSIGVGDGGRVLLHCFSGCKPEAICTSLGIKLSDLFEAPLPNDRRIRGSAIYENSTSPAKDRISVDKRKSFSTREAAEADLGKGKLGTPGGSWIYHTADGTPVIWVHRFNRLQNGKRKKTFRPISRTEAGWVIGDPPGLMPLFRLPELLAAPPASPVFVLEGERKTEMAAGLEWVATTSVHGSGAAHKTDWSPLNGRSVVVLIDNDKAGEKYGEEVAKLALAAGASDVRVIRLVDLWPDLPPKGDLADLIERSGGDADEINTIRNRIMSHIDNTPPVTPAAPDEWEAFTPFPLELLPASAKDLVFHGAQAQQVDPALLAVPMLGVLAAAIGNSREIELEPGWREPCILWVAVIAKSGAGKSPALKLVSAPLESLDNECFERFKQESAAHDAALAAWEGQRRAAKTNAPPTTEPKPVEPHCEHVITQDPTYEAVVAMLTHSPRGLALVVEELATWFGSFTRYGGSGGRTSTEEARWLPFHSGGMIKSNRVSRQYRSPKSSLSIIGMVQPAILKSMLTREDFESGLVARFLMASPTQPTKVWRGGKGLHPGVVPAYERLIQGLHSLQAPLTPDGRLDPVAIPLSIEAEPIWGNFFTSTHANFAESDNRTQAMLAKLIASAARLALIIHLARVADGEGCDPNRIDDESIMRGIKIAHWFWAESNRANRLFSESEDERELRELREYIARRGGSVTARGIAQSYTPLKNQSEQAEMMLRKLAELGYGTYLLDDHDGSRGRPTYRYTQHAPKIIYENSDSPRGNGISVDRKAGELPPGWEAGT
jgi:hypothetical protein